MIANNTLILGLDISTKNTGWSVIQYTDDKYNLLDYGDIPRGKMDIDEVLVNFEKEFQKILDKWNPDVISAEAPFVGSNRQTIEKLCYVHGVMLLMAKKERIPVTYYSVMTLKSKVLGGIKAKKEDGTKKTGKEMKQEVQDKVIEIFGKENFIKEYNDDITDSMSAAYTYILMDGLPVEKKKKTKKKKTS
jgi:crossover junction endodeoxyribonuclease RuvC